MKCNPFIPFLIGVILFGIPFYAGSQNYVTTLAGTGQAGFMNGDTSIAQFDSPFGICLDAAGNVYLADAQNNQIRKISTDGEVSTYAGSVTPGYVDGPAEEARFNQPLNICFDPDGNMYVSDFLNQRIRMISSDMQVSTVAGSGVPGWQNGPALEARFNYPRGICLDDTGNIYIGDSWNHRIRRISTDGMVSDWAGGGTAMGVASIGDWVDASDTAARFYTPCELSIDPDNTIFVADAYNHRIRKIDPNRMVTTVAGSGGFGPNGGSFQNGPVEEAQFDVPTACHVIPDGTIFVGDGQNQRVREISIYGYVSTFAGSGNAGFENGPDTLATFNFPRGTVLDIETNRLYTVDYYNHAVRIIHLVPTVGITDDALQAFINVFPNPAKDHIIVTMPTEMEWTSVKMVSSSGMPVHEVPFLGKKSMQLQVSDLPVGMYYLLFLMGTEVRQVEKVLVVH
jgi:hypothetical protein